MPSFALIAEGITDQVIIEKVIKVFYKSHGVGDVVVNSLQPTRDATDIARQQEGDFGGWQQVLEHCSIADNLHEAFAFNDYIVVHLDSDVSNNPDAGINSGLCLDDIVCQLEGLIEERIDSGILEAYCGRIILIIAVHSTDCWLLPLFTSISHERKAVRSCEEKLGRVVRRGNLYFKKDGPCYMDLVKNLKKKNHLDDMASCSPSLKSFLEKLPVS